MVVDSRTSDAIALAVRAECGIFIKENIMDIVSVEIDSSELEKYAKDHVSEVVKPEELTSEELEMLSLEDLEELLNMAVNEEKYELAVNLRDTIQRKKKA